MSTSIPDSYCYYWCMYKKNVGSDESFAYAEKALERLPEQMTFYDYDMWTAYLMMRLDDTRLFDLCRRYFDSGLYHYEKPTSQEEYDRQEHELINLIITHTNRPVYFSAMNGKERNAPWEKHLYNEGLTLRYSEKKYDNLSVKRRNVEQRYLMEYLLEIARVVNERLHGTDCGATGNPSEKAKTAAFWQGIRALPINPECDLARYAMESAKRDREFAAACEKQRAERSDRNRVVDAGTAHWNTLAEWAKLHLAEYYAPHARLLAKAANPDRIGRLTKPECVRLARFEKQAREQGFDN